MNDIELNVEKGEFITLLGPSGCGKTTLLRVIAGLEAIETGKIVLNGADVSALEPSRRNVNTVFQNYALFPHLNVFDNIAYGPRIRGLKKNEIKPMVTEMLSLVKMEGYETRMPHQLSGGQRQRVAIARALINRPDVVLLDEPLGALDLKLRKHMQSELKRIQKLTKITFIYVTHDQDEALNMSDRIAVMNGGRIEQTGSPSDIYNNPATLFTAGFVGERNLVPVDFVSDGGSEMTVEIAGNPVAVRKPSFPETDNLVLALHTDRLRFSKTQENNTFPVTVRDMLRAGSRTVIEAVCGGDNGEITLTGIEYNSSNEYAPGETVYAGFAPESGVIVRDSDGGTDE